MNYFVIELINTLRGQHFFLQLRIYVTFFLIYSLVNETGIAPTHSIKKLKSIFAEKAGEPLPPPIPLPPSPKSREPPKVCIHVSPLENRQ